MEVRVAKAEFQVADETARAENGGDDAEVDVEDAAGSKGAEEVRALCPVHQGTPEKGSPEKATPAEANEEEKASNSQLRKE